MTERAGITPKGPTHLWRVVFEWDTNGGTPEAEDFDDGYEIVGARDAEHAVSKACDFLDTASLPDSWQAWARSPAGDVTTHGVTLDWDPAFLVSDYRWPGDGHSTTERVDTSELLELKDIERLIGEAKLNAPGRQLLMWYVGKLSVWHGIAERWKTLFEERQAVDDARHRQLTRQADEWKQKAEREAELRARDYAIVMGILLLAGVALSMLEALR